MENKYSQIPLDYLLPYFEKWVSVLNRREVVNVFFLPKSDALFRAYQYKDWLKKERKISLEIIDMEAHLITTPEGLESAIGKVYRNKEILLIARNIFTGPEGNHYSRVIEESYAKGRGIVIFNEGMVSEFDSYVVSTTMHQHLSIMRVYPIPVIERYARNVATLWELKIDNDKICTISKNCSGLPWLINDILRHVKDTPDIDVSQCFEFETYKWKLEQIIRSLPRQHQQVLFSADKKIDIQCQKELADFGLIDNSGKVITCIQNWIDSYKKHSLVINKESVLVDNQDLGMYFSDSERIILDYFRNSGEATFSREMVAQVFWGKYWEDKYSDWSLDQVISRLRKKIVTNKIPINIVTKKGIGYAIK
jgi:hypothetical protein